MKKCNPVITIISPVYKTDSKLLIQSIDSILMNPSLEFELILVDDGSENISAVLCDEYAEKDDRVLVIHKKNGGTSTARNAGLAQAKGEYICFIDSDDYIECELISKLLYIAKDSPDIVFFNSTAHYTDKIERWDYITKDENVSAEEALKRFLTGRLIPSCWAKMFRRELTKNMYLNEKLLRGQDEEYFIRVLLCAHKVYFMNYNGYHYVVHTGSATKIQFSEKVFCIDDALGMVKENVLEKYPYFKREISDYIVTGLLLMAQQYDNSTNKTRKDENKLKKIFKSHFKDICICKVSLKRKCGLLIFGIIGYNVYHNINKLVRGK